MIGSIENGIIFKNYWNDGHCYKNFQNFKNQKGICYVPEYAGSEHEISPSYALFMKGHPVPEGYVEVRGGIKDKETGEFISYAEECDIYYFEDFIRIAGNNKSIATFLFETVSWQYPETLLEEMFDCGFEKCGNCEYIFDAESRPTDSRVVCSNCGAS